MFPKRTKIQFKKHLCYFSWFSYSFYRFLCVFIEVSTELIMCKGRPLYMNTNITVGWDRSSDLQITRKASRPLTQRGTLFVVNPPRVFAVKHAYFMVFYGTYLMVLLWLFWVLWF